MFLLLAIAGCTMPEGEARTELAPLVLDGEAALPETLTQVAEIQLKDNGGIRLALRAGWGQLRIQTEEVVKVSVARQGLEFTPVGDPEGLYTHGEFTVIRLDAWPDVHESDSSSFSWIGPMSADRHAGPPWTEANLEVNPVGDLVLLTVGTTVPGYELVLGHDSGESPVHWDLAGHPDMAVHLPEPEALAGSSTGAGEVAYRRQWTQQVSVDAAAVYAMAWQADEWGMPVNGARAGIASEAFSLGPPGTDAEAGGTAPVLGFGTSFSGWGSRVDASAESRELVATYWYESTTLGTTTHDEGLAVVVVPLASA